MKDVSVILITWNSERYVQPCLNAVLQAVKGFMYEILIIDNGSTDATLSLLEAYEDERVHLYRYEENRGIACARNVGLQRATGNFIWILDIDTLPTSAAWQGMFDFMHAHSDCGICACQLFHASGELQDSCRRYPSLRYKILNVLSAICPSPQLARLNESQFYHVAMQGEEPFEVEYVIGACQVIRREVVQEIGLLDNRIFYGPEDADYCLRAHRAGWKVFYLPQFAFRHDYQRMTNKRLFSRMSWLHLRALLYFFRKHRRF